jgi:asparagine synthase (glutamine-hydrolysing)
MCGFAGVIAWDDDRFGISREILAAMSASIAHRGPDGEGIYFTAPCGATGGASAACGLAHRRLAIIDPDPRANQPFADARGPRGRQLVFNGEIYNFRELRAQLEQLRPDYAWRTHCDTEVLLVAYDAWGEACVERLDGMFAFAVWDPADQSLFLARDRMGQKPLYLAFARGGDGGGGGGGRTGGVGAIAFASELAALRAVPWVDSATDDAALGHYLRWGYIPAPLTIYRGCEKLPPARWMRVTPRAVEVQQYFDPNVPPDASAESSRPSNSIVQTTRDLLTAAVRRQLVADVPLGCFLSGGIDSSIIAAAMKASVDAGQPVLTFSIGFDDPRYDETPFAAEVARHLGTQHHAFTVRPNAAEDLPKLAAVFGEPFGDSSALPTHYLARETRQHVKVALSGDGGDELFAGYDRYRALLLGEGFRALPEPLRKIALNKIWERLPSTHPKSSVARLKRLLASLHLPPAERYDSFMRYFDEPTVAALLGDRGRPSDGVRWLQHQFASLADGRDVVRAALALDRVTYLPEDLLTKVDHAAMLHALEVRSPFMDPALVHFAAGLSTEQLLGTRGGAASFMQSPMTTPAKLILRDAFAADLPPGVFKRRKTGFAVPIGEWFRGDLRPLLHDSLTAANSFAASHFTRPTIDQLLADHDARQADHSQRLYALLMLELWWRQSRS